MSRKTNLNDLGLSRQSSRTYNVIHRKWSANLDKTLRQLDIEHQTNISKILNERFDLKNVHHALKSESESLAKRENMESLPIINFTASTSFMKCASLSEMENSETTENFCELAKSEIPGNSASKTVDSSQKTQGSKKYRLPSIAEEIPSQRHPPRSSEHWLPPLPAEALPSRSRKHSDRHQEKPACRTRQRSSTLPVGITAEDRWRKVRSPFSSLSDTGSSRKEKRVQDDDLRPAEELSSTWPTDLENCRYLRRRATTSPAIFRD